MGTTFSTQSHLLLGKQTAASPMSPATNLPGVDLSVGDLRSAMSTAMAT